MGALSDCDGCASETAVGGSSVGVSLSSIVDLPIVKLEGRKIADLLEEKDVGLDFR